MVGEVHLPEIGSDEGGYLVAVRSREEETAFEAWQHPDDLSHLVLETQLQALVELIDDEGADCCAIEVLLTQVVGSTTGRGDNDVRLHLTQHAVLIHRWTPPVASHSPQATLHRLDDLHRLRSEFAGGNEDECKRPGRGGGSGRAAELSGVFHGVLELLGERKQIGQRLATARGREEHKLVMTSVGSNGLFLHGIQRIDTKVLKDFLLGHGETNGFTDLSFQNSMTAKA